MSIFNLNINGENRQVEADPDMPLLWVLRDLVGLRGTKFTCGGGFCGACTVHKDGKPIRACMTPVAKIGNAAITTIEGISANDELHAVQQAWIEEQVSQCGYCQSGQIMSAVALLATNPNPSDDDINKAMNGNLCRCGTYPRIRKAIHLAAKSIHSNSNPAVSLDSFAAQENENA